MPIFPPSFTPQESCVGLTMTTNVSIASTATRVTTSATITVSATHLASVCPVPANHLQADVVGSSRPVQAISPIQLFSCMYLNQRGRVKGGCQMRNIETTH
ncbi:hypothetical protein L1887_14335 [Cichorium endivia]|nr:hypothetical protein L1887_14335 [Cichorium endivia]